ncbi:MAG: pathogenicity locus [Ignavibacteriae bacterium]|nr:MAG: pathogenicity locus [Ignavibacteriota bacterium]
MPGTQKIRTRTERVNSAKSFADREKALQTLRTIPGVGKSISVDLWNLGFRSVDSLKNKDPEKLYRRHCVRAGVPVDRCLLYVFRCAVYYASHRKHDDALLLWWNWKD